jgi:hypothetical protein
VTASIFPVMAGISYMYTVPWFPLSIGAEVYGGFGFAGLNIETTMQYFFAATTVESFGGSCFVLDSALKLSYAFNTLFSAGLNMGYFAATASKLKNDKIGLTMPNLTDYSKDLELDFSGMKYEVSLNFSF